MIPGLKPITILNCMSGFYLTGGLSAKREDILELLEDVGNVSEDVKILIDNEEDLEILKRWLKLAAKVGSISEFMNKAKLN
jgi:hypothetical protein